MSKRILPVPRAPGQETNLRIPHMHISEDTVPIHIKLHKTFSRAMARDDTFGIDGLMRRTAGENENPGQFEFLVKVHGGQSCNPSHVAYDGAVGGTGKAVAISTSGALDLSVFLRWPSEPPGPTYKFSVYRCVAAGFKPKTTVRERCDGARVRRNPSYPLPLGHCWDGQTHLAPVSKLPMSGFWQMRKVFG